MNSACILAAIQVAAGHTIEGILGEYLYLEAADLAEALSYAAWRAAEVEVPLRRQ